jgi:hypothetical protein
LPETNLSETPDIRATTPCFARSLSAKRSAASSPGQLIAAIEIASSAALLGANVDAGFK